MARFNKIKDENQEANRLGIGTHTVKISKILYQKNNVPYEDKNGNEFWLIIFQDKEESEHIETFFWGGSMSHRLGRLLRAIHLLEPSENIETCGKEFEPDDLLGNFLNITIEEDLNAKVEKYKFKIAKEGFEAYTTGTKPKAKAKEIEEESEPPF